MDKGIGASVFEPAFLKPLELRQTPDTCVICKQQVIRGDRYYEAKDRLFHEECTPSELVPVMKFLGFSPKVRGEDGQ